MIDLKILSTPGCAPCKVVEGIAAKLQQEFKDLQVEKIDLMEHPEFAVEYEVMSSPTVVINGKVAFVGAVNEDQLREKMEEVRQQ